jgi:membrane-bound serine protease (ClpP class)
MQFVFWTFVCLGVAFFLAALELVLPSGMLLFLAAAALLGSVVFAFFSDITFGAVYTIILFTAVPFLLYYFTVWWVQSKVGKIILLDTENDPALQPDERTALVRSLAGKTGVAKSKMMLSGLIEIDGRCFNAVSDVEVISAGERIKVVKADGIEIIVRKIQNGIGSEYSENKNDTNNVLSPQIEDPFET